MMLESDIQKQGPQNARLWHVLLGLRYILPLLSALLFVVLGVFYNVFALEAGKLVRISVLRLFFNTLKNARVYLMGGHVAPSVKSLYIWLIVLGVGTMLLFLASVFFAAFALYTAYRVRRARASGLFDEERRAKILLRAALPNRVLMAISNLLLLPFAFFAEIFSWVSGNFSIDGTSIFYVRFNVTAFVVVLFMLATLVLAFLLRSHEKEIDFDLYDCENKRETAENGEE